MALYSVDQDGGAGANYFSATGLSGLTPGSAWSAAFWLRSRKARPGTNHNAGEFFSHVGATTGRVQVGNAFTGSSSIYTLRAPYRSATPANGNIIPNADQLRRAFDGAWHHWVFALGASARTVVMLDGVAFRATIFVGLEAFAGTLTTEFMRYGYNGGFSVADFQWYPNTFIRSYDEARYLMHGGTLNRLAARWAVGNSFGADVSGHGADLAFTGTRDGLFSTVDDPPQIAQRFRRVRYFPAYYVAVPPSGAAPIGLDAVPVSRSRYVVAADCTIGDVAEAAPPVTRGRSVVASSGAAGSVAADEAVLVRSRVVTAGDATTGAAAFTGEVLARARWVLAAVVTLGGADLDAVPVARDRLVAPITTEAPPDLIPVARGRVVVAADVTVGGVATSSAPIARDRVVVAASLTLGTVAAVAPALSRDRFVLATDGAVAGTLALEAAPAVRDRVVVAGALAFDTGLDFDAATETRDRWSVAADGDAELVGAGGGILSRERWVLAAVAVVGALALDAAPVARDRHVAAGTVSTLAPHLLEAAPVSRDRFVLPAGGAAGTSLGGGAIATRDRFVVAATVSTGSAAADLVPVTRDRVVVPALATSGLTAGSAGVARDRFTVAADVVAVGGLAGASRPVARDRWVVAAVASSGVLAFDAVPVTRDRFVLPVAAGEPQQAAGAPVPRDRHVVAASLSFVRRFPGTRGVVLLGVPQGLVVLGVPQGLVILDEEGNVGSYAMKRGDDDPPLDFQCTGTDGLPVAFVGDEALEVGVRRSGESAWALLKPATFLDAALGKIRVVWDIGDSEFLAVGDMEFELQVLRTGARATTFPAEGYGVFPIWQDIVPDAES